MGTEGNKDDSSVSAGAKYEKEADKEVEEEVSVVLDKLTILSPRLLDRSDVAEKVIHLPLLAAEEPAQSLRLALSEIVEYAHFTSFRLELDPSATANTGTTTYKPDLVSPFTGPDAVVKSHSPDRTGLELDDYGDLTLLLEYGLRDGSSFRIVLEEYNPFRVREHVLRLRQLLSGEHTPISHDLVEADGATDKPTNGEAENNLGKSTSSGGAVVKEDGSNGHGGNKNGKTNNSTTTKAKLKELPVFIPSETPISLSSFISDCCGEEVETYDKVLEKLDETCQVPYSVRHSGFHPPPADRRLLGDLAYIEFVSTSPSKGSNEEVIHVTASATGFYLNQSAGTKFDPSPAKDPCFSHTLLDCVLKHSKSFRNAWKNALDAAKKRSELNSKSSAKQPPLETVYRASLLGGKSIDSIILRPSWLMSSKTKKQPHTYNVHRLEADLENTFGVDLRGGPIRDWNEELQSAREMPIEMLQERIDRARLIHKVLSDFGEAAVSGAVAIVEGHITPMNPNESARSHVYLHNNIFFSRALDNGMYDTYRVATGDNAARKAASRDASTIGILHRLDVEGLHSLGTVILDYLGTRIVCQSVIPGLLHGENCHKVIYGAVETGSPLTSDVDMHKLMEDTIGKNYWIGSRAVPTVPLSDERVAAAKAALSKTLALASLSPTKRESTVDTENEEEPPPTVPICGPMEVKGILGADKRRYVLDLARLAPRDANWVPKSLGGTGHHENLPDEGKSKNGMKNFIPESLEDDEWTMAVLRNELINSYVNNAYSEWSKSKQEERKGAKEKILEEQSKDNPSGAADAIKAFAKMVEEEEEAFVDKLRFNVNVFLPNTKSLEGIDDEAFAQTKKDEQHVRDAATYLMNDVIPKLTAEIRDSQSPHLPVDGAALTEYIHRAGINCRYLGKLAVLAHAEEEKDKEKEGTGVTFRRKMPLYWLELLECEMVARAAKHVLDSFLTLTCASVSNQPAVIVAAVLSALISTGEESAAETEKRLARDSSSASHSPTFQGLAKQSFVIPDRTEVWDAVQKEVGRRFRYNLTLYNSKSSARTLFVPLLRRVCQRSGIRLLAKDYPVGTKCLSGIVSYPISADNVVRIVPMIKHAASTMDGFVPYTQGSGCVSLSLHILLGDAKNKFDSAQLYLAARSLSQALQLSQEAAELFQKVTDSPMHTSIARCMDLSAVVLFQAQEPQLAASHAARSLALSAQLGGFDCHETLSGHASVAHILLASNPALAVKHIRASLYLMKLMGGSHYIEMVGKCHQLGTIYLEAGFYEEAYAVLKYARDKLVVNDIVMEGIIARSTAVALSGMSRYKEAIENEKRSLSIFAAVYGEDSELTKQSNDRVTNYTKLAVKKGTESVAEDKLRKEEEAANAIANQILHEEDEESKKRKKAKKKGRSKKK